MIIIKGGTSVVYQVSKRAKPKVGKVGGFEIDKNGLRYKILNRVHGKFLSANPLDPSGHPYVYENRWVIDRWLKPERIITVL